MPVIKAQGVVPSDWAYFPDGVDAGERAPAGGVTVSLGQYAASRDALSATNTRVGVRLQPDDDVTALEVFVNEIALIEISFPRFTDGRGFSQAQLLRRRYGYQGELRAVGHVLRDQIFYMMRAGIDAFEMTTGDVQSVQAALSDFSVAYQPSTRGPTPAFRNRS